VVGIYSRVVKEAGALFGTCHYPSFHFLVTCSDDLGYLGLEHRECSINGVRERDLVDPGHLRGWVGNLLPHEYVHSWCGKFRRPAGMCTPDFHTPQKTKLLWVYEGLAEYLGELLMVRSGMIDAAEYRRMLTATIDSLVHREGRRWRSLEDTAVASPLLRDGSPNWSELRRGQDYYFEGALIWLEADAIIRERTKGRRSLDDFCRKFLGPGPTDAHVIPYDLDDVVKALTDVCDFDWGPFLRDRTEKPLDALPLDVLTRCGYRLGYTNRPPNPSDRIARRGGAGVSARDSLGLGFDGEGKITDVIPGMIGDKSGLGPGMKVIGVNGRVFSCRRLLDALADSVSRRKIEFLLIEGDHFRTVVLDYADGPRYLEVVRDPDKPDLLAEILKPIANPAKGR
jgi:predicted metalloprotease with PDZ domain